MSSAAGRTLWLLVGLSGMAAAIRLGGVVQVTRRPALVLDDRAVGWRPADRGALAAVLDSAMARGALGGRSSAVEPSASPEEATPPAPVPGPRPPALEVVGTVGGPPWRAVVRGVPGAAGDVVVRPGDRFGLLVIASIERRRLTAIWEDSTFVLAMTGGMP